MPSLRRVDFAPRSIGAHRLNDRTTGIRDWLSRTSRRQLGMLAYRASPCCRTYGRSCCGSLTVCNSGRFTRIAPCRTVVPGRLRWRKRLARNDDRNSLAGGASRNEPCLPGYRTNRNSAVLKMACAKSVQTPGSSDAETPRTPAWLLRKRSISSSSESTGGRP